VTEVFLLDATDLSHRPFRVEDTLPAKLMSASMTWDGVGNLIIVGRTDSGTPNGMTNTWRFRPSSLNAQPLYCTGPFCAGAPDLIQGHSWEAVGVGAQGAEGAPELVLVEGVGVSEDEDPSLPSGAHAFLTWRTKA
jgi:hypothetical protein